VDSRNTIFEPAQIRISSTKALKFDRTSGSKQHNINFHILFDYEPGITCFFSTWTVYWYTNKASIESLLLVDSKNIILGPWKIHVSATGALKFNRTSGSKQHNINFHVLFNYEPGITCFLSSLTVYWYTNKASIERLLFVDSKNIILGSWKIQVSATGALKFNRTSGSKQHNINFHVLFNYEPGIICFLSSLTVYWYTNKASIESLLFVDSKNIIFGPRNIQVSATEALKFNRTSGSKQHNINFHVFFDYTAG
jgi:ribosomal protein S17E